MTYSLFDEEADTPPGAGGMARPLPAPLALERALHESELRFRQLAENIDDVLWVADPQLQSFSYVGPPFERIWGVPCEHVYRDGSAWLQQVHAEDAPALAEVIERVRITGLGFRNEYRILRPDGSQRWIFNRGFPILDPAGRVARLAGIASDITERKLAEQRIARLNRTYAVMSGINNLILRVGERRALFEGVCSVAVEVGRFHAAWIECSADARLLAQAGCPDAARVLAGASRPPAPDAAVFCQDLAHETSLPPHAGCDALGSWACLPVRADGQAVARLCLVAAEPGAFDADERRLLAELAGDISFALDHMHKAERLHYLARFDALTGLANSTLFHERLPRLIEAAQRSGHKLAVLVLDIERFKRINDTLGRHAGDQVLQALAQRLRRDLPEALLARVGADRFAIVFDQARQDADIARELEERLHAWLDEPAQVGGTELRIACKLGIALHPDDGSEADALFSHAEAALKRAKATGDRYVFYAEQMSERIAEQLALENKLRRAIEREEFALHYQPKVDAATRRLVGVEALIRWASPELGLVSPAQFVPLLEETGLILEVGAWALRRAVLDQRAWREQGLPVPRVAVNVSAIQLRKPDFVETVRAALQGEQRCELDIEITESLVMQDIEANIAKLGALRALGSEVAIDDFGTGYSSLAYLAKLPVQALKIDRSFVNAMVHDPAVMTLVASVLSMAQAMRLKVVAEGVETEEQAQVLQRLGCDQLQGYLVSRPLPPEQLQAKLRELSPG
ncbi:MAG: sensor domain-containing protein [Pseudomonadota bacterium]